MNSFLYIIFIISILLILILIVGLGEKIVKIPQNTFEINKFKIKVLEFSQIGDPIAVYKGNYDNSKRLGYGVALYWDGRLYSGQWKDDLPHGYGLCFYGPSGLFYEGSYCKGVKQGVGQLSIKSPIDFLALSYSTSSSSSVGVSVSEPSQANYNSNSSSSNNNTHSYRNNNHNTYHNNHETTSPKLSEEDMLTKSLPHFLKVITNSQDQQSSLINSVIQPPLTATAGTVIGAAAVGVGTVNVNIMTETIALMNLPEAMHDELPEVLTGLILAQQVKDCDVELLLQDCGEGLVYQGSFRNDKAHGEGVLFWKHHNNCHIMLPEGTFRDGIYVIDQ